MVRPAEPGRSVHAGSGGSAGFLCLVAAGYLVVTLGLRSAWSTGTFSRSGFAAQYDAGVYAPRVVGRELALALESALRELGVDPRLGGLVPDGATMYPALVLLNGLAVLVVAHLVRRMLIAGVGPGTRADLVALGVTGVAIWSLHVVTPYDHLSLALMLLMLMVAGRAAAQAKGARPDTLLVVGALVAVAVATRETALVAVAALVAVSIIDRAAMPRPLAAVAAVAGAATYVALRLDAPEDLTDGATWSVNVDLGTVSVFGLVVVALALIGWRWLLERGDVWRQEPAGRRALLVTWALCAPYLVVSALVGYWYEALRLVLPVLVVDLWVRLHLHRPAVTT